MKIFNWLLIIFNNLNSLISCLVLLLAPWQVQEQLSANITVGPDQPFKQALPMAAHQTDA